MYSLKKVGDGVHLTFHKRFFTKLMKMPNWVVLDFSAILRKHLKDSFRFVYYADTKQAKQLVLKLENYNKDRKDLPYILYFIRRAVVQDLMGPGEDMDQTLKILLYVDKVFTYNESTAEKAFTEIL